MPRNFRIHQFNILDLLNELSFFEKLTKLINIKSISFMKIIKKIVLMKLNSFSVF